jgi:hypothetical protein
MKNLPDTYSDNGNEFHYVLKLQFLKICLFFVNFNKF